MSGWQPIKIGASIPVSAIRAAYLERGLDDAITLGHELFGDSITDLQIGAIARKEATLRGYSPNITYHDRSCTTCLGSGQVTHAAKIGAVCDCAMCHGDGFAPSIEGDS